ncbi:hypothetical protein V7654_14400, partial [Bacillus sp. JJ1609]|uniref:hypothetical protein n=1 Tax=Bacillus sp. JJ1609 TaxID=3122977 RepID=UPI002FFF6B0E
GLIGDLIFQFFILFGNQEALQVPSFPIFALPGNQEVFWVSLFLEKVVRNETIPNPFCLQTERSREYPAPFFYIIG